MLITLVRHGIATPRELAADDASRSLTEKGVKKSLRIGRWLVRLGINPNEIWTSPMARAHQTAELMNRAFLARLRVVESLASGNDPDAVLQDLATVPDGLELMLVGHEPMLGQLATLVIAGNKLGTIDFKKGGAAAFEIDQRTPQVRGRMLWLLTPRQMKRN